MKWPSILALSALLAVTAACEKHPASELPLEHGSESHHAEAKSADEHAAKPAEHSAAQPHGDAKPAEAPKFFPETK